MTFQPGAALYSQAFGTVPAGVSFPVYVSAAPTSTLTQGPFGIFQLGQRLIWPNNGEYVLLGLTETNNILSANWVQTASATGSGNVLSVTGTANQINAAPNTGNVILSLPTPLIVPGSIAAATTITAGAGFIATTGNLTLSGAGSGIVTTPTVVAAGASPQIANGRVFSVTFSGVSIASGASQTFTITNSAITGASTVTSLTWSGATAGSALSIASITPSAGSLAIVMTNGTSATMVTDVANITFVGIVLN